MCMCLSPRWSFDALTAAPLPLDLQDQLKKQKEVRIEICQSERQLLNAMLSALLSTWCVHMLTASLFADQIQAWDPDVLVAHNFYGFDLDVLLHRMQENKTTGWYRLGQLKKGKYVPMALYLPCVCVCSFGLHQNA